MPPFFVFYIFIPLAQNFSEVNDVFSYDSCNRGEWIFNTIRYRNSIIPSYPSDKVINIYLSDNVVKEKFEPMHIVLLSCLIDELKTNNYKVRLIIEDETIKDFLWNDIKVSKYWNVFDHADANGYSFSYISFDDNFISVAVCDFGKGIVQTIREAHPEYYTDSIALENAMKNGVTSRSKSHNAGYGLYDIATMLGDDDYLRIVRNKS